MCISRNFDTQNWIPSAFFNSSLIYFALFGIVLASIPNVFKITFKEIVIFDSLKTTQISPCRLSIVFQNLIIIADIINYLITFKKAYHTFSIQVFCHYILLNAIHHKSRFFIYVSRLLRICDCTGLFFFQPQIIYF